MNLTGPYDIMTDEAQERRVFDCIASEVVSIDQVIAETELPAHRALSTISVLEMKHLVRRVSGNYVARR